MILMAQFTHQLGKKFPGEEPSSRGDRACEAPLLGRGIGSGKCRGWGEETGAEDGGMRLKTVRRDAVNWVEVAQTKKPPYRGGFAMG